MIQHPLSVTSLKLSRLHCIPDWKDEVQFETGMAVSAEKGTWVSSENFNIKSLLDNT